MKDKISMRQAGIIILFVIFSNKILLLPGLMYDYIKADALFAVFMLFLIEFLAVPIFLKLILSKYLTKVGADLIYIIAAVFMIFKALLTFSIVYVYFKEQIYQSEVIWFAFITSIPIVNHAVLSGIKPTARTMEIFLGAILIGFIFCL